MQGLQKLSQTSNAGAGSPEHVPLKFVGSLKHFRFPGVFEISHSVCVLPACAFHPVCFFFPFRTSQISDFFSLKLMQRVWIQGIVLPSPAEPPIAGPGGESPGISSIAAQSGGTVLLDDGTGTIPVIPTKGVATPRPGKYLLIPFAFHLVAAIACFQPLSHWSLACGHRYGYTIESDTSFNRIHH